MNNKIDLKKFWEANSCGESLYLQGFSKQDYDEQSRIRYSLEPQLTFGEFDKFSNKKTLEIGVGLGADHQKLAEAGAILWGIDLTERAIGHTQRRFDLCGLKSNLQVADAENLPFEDSFFECIYTWGVIHHSPNTSKIIDEIHRVLKKGGLAKIMIYHKYSIVGYMLWIRYALLKLQPWKSLNFIYDKYLESPGTKAYSNKEAHELLKNFEIEPIKTPLCHADLLTSEVGQRHRGIFLRIAKALWPRFLLRLILPNHGLAMMISCYKK